MGNVVDIRPVLNRIRYLEEFVTHGEKLHPFQRRLIVLKAKADREKVFDVSHLRSVVEELADPTPTPMFVDEDLYHRLENLFRE